MLPANNPFSDIVESFYIETKERLFFAVKGLEHPPDRYIAVLRYAPDPEKGDRRKDGVHYRRFYHFAEQELLLRSSYPQFLAYDPFFNTTLQSVPKSSVHRVFNPCQRLQEMAAAPTEMIERDAVAFADLLQKNSGIPWSAIGISGSLLIGLDTEKSDLDFSIFGAENCRKAYEALAGLLDFRSVPDLQRLDASGIEELYAQRVVDTHMDFRNFSALEGSKVCQGSFRQRPYFIRFIKKAHEIADKYGDNTYTLCGRAAIVATVVDHQESIFTPCRYAISGVRVLDGLPLDVTEIVSFRGRFCEQAQTGESVRAAGTVERIENKLGEIRYRLLLGNSPEDTMVGIREIN
jgi:uncharacterized protein